MKKLIAVLLLAVMTAALLCACGEEELTIDPKYVRTYVYDNSSMDEQTTREITLYDNGTYVYTRDSSLDGNSGEFPGMWGVNRKGIIIFTGNESGGTSEGTPSEDGMTLNIADISRADDTIGSGIYKRKTNQ